MSLATICEAAERKNKVLNIDKQADRHIERQTDILKY